MFPILDLAPWCFLASQFSVMVESLVHVRLGQTPGEGPSRREGKGTEMYPQLLQEALVGAQETLHKC